MPAHWCIYKLILYIHLIKYVFNISEYKAMLIKLLIYLSIYANLSYKYIFHTYMCMYVCMNE